ncbi:hypothetical protein BgiBS90_013816 [Biomphalaria glabrata]|nr:hypothetical protein BgiBS90_013816 [Biomphalaria glabrata]
MPLSVSETNDSADDCSPCELCVSSCINRQDAMDQTRFCSCLCGHSNLGAAVFKSGVLHAVVVKLLDAAIQSTRENTPQGSQMKITASDVYRGISREQHLQCLMRLDNCNEANLLAASKESDGLSNLLNCFPELLNSTRLCDTPMVQSIWQVLLLLWFLLCLIYLGMCLI